MGNGKSIFCNKYPEENKKICIALFGLDNAGKTTTARALAGESTENVVPTIGFGTFKLPAQKQYSVTLYDLGGGSHIRNIWGKYYAEVHGLVFMVDANDKERLEEAGEEMHKLITNPLVTGKPLLILANKQDLLGSLNKAEISEALKLPSLSSLSQCPCLLESCSAQSLKEGRVDSNIRSAIDWLLEVILHQWKPLQTRVTQDVVKMLEEEEREKIERKKRVEMRRKMREESEHQSSANNNVGSGKRRENRNEGEDGNETNGFDIEDSSYNPFKPIHQLTSASKPPKSNVKKDSKKVKKSRGIFSKLRSLSQNSDTRRSKVSPVPPL